MATLLFSAGLVACKTHDELKIDVVCEAICPCFAPDDQLDACLAECRVDLNPNMISDACFSCVLEEGNGTCQELDDTCEQVCNF